MRVVVRIGGSVIASPINPKLIDDYVKILKRLKNKGHDVVVVVGGGALAREFIEVARNLGLREEDQDEVAISVSRIFAQLFMKKLGKLGCGKVISSVEEASECLSLGKIGVLGGLKPGMTTDTVAALVAERVGADMVIKATDQDGVYTKDPRKHADAVKLDRLSFEDLALFFSEDKHKAGIHQIIDPEAIRVLKRVRVKFVVVNGFNPENVLLAVKGERVGTIIE
ncbi:MAG: UMP kinase [Candidatus Bathyarchaeia archaeon]